MEKLAGVCKRICVFLLTLASWRRCRPVTDDSKEAPSDATRGVRRLKRRQGSCYNGYFQALRPKRTACGVFSLPAPDVHRTSLLHIKILTSPFITASFCCTIVSDMGYRCLSEWRNAASFCGNSVSHVFFLFRQLNLTCLFRRRVSDTLLG